MIRELNPTLSLAEAASFISEVPSVLHYDASGELALRVEREIAAVGGVVKVSENT